MDILWALALFAFTALFWGSHSKFTPTRNYCNRSMCSRGGPHIGCKHNRKWATTCKSPEEVSFSLGMMKTAVHHHNFYREKVAVGNGTTRNDTFPKAADMLYVDWDEELAYLASLNVKQCEMKHDKCRDVDVESGQNLYYTCTSGASHSPNKTIADGIRGWYKEIKDAAVTNVANYSGVGIAYKEINHFGQLAWGNTHRVGCAMSRYRYDYYDKGTGQTWPMKCDLFACNYAPMGNWITTPMYKIGDPCSKCPSGKCKTRYQLCKTEYKGSKKSKKPKKPTKKKKPKKSTKTKSNSRRS